jgi:tetratricopeptide (TPR) repeat protein
MAEKIIRKVTDYRFILIILIATALIITGMIFLNDIVVSIRLLELKAFLRDMDKQASDMSTVGMVSKFKLHKRLYENRMDEDELNRQEYTIAYRAIESKDYEDITLTKYRQIAPPVLTVMNFLRFFLQKPPVDYILSDRDNNKLTLAYYNERQKKYTLALDIYDDLLSSGEVEPGQIHIILLHQGYCLAIVGEYDKAKEKFLEIIKNFENEDVAITAARLLRFIEELEEEVRKVKESDDSPLMKSEKLYKLIAFKEALEILEKVVEDEEKASEKVDYLRARCYEETGEKETSVKIYQDIVENSIEGEQYDSETAKQANRRILFISATEEEGEKIRELSIKNNELIADPEFPGLLDTADKLTTAYDREEETLKQSNDKAQTETESPQDNDEETVSTSGKDNETGENEQEFDTFLDNSINDVEEKIETLIEEQQITPAPTPLPTPAPTRTKAPRKKTTQPSPEPTPTQEPGPYSKTYKNEQGDVEKVEDYNETGSLVRVKEFNEEGKITQLTEFDPETGEKKGYYVYEFDENGIPVKVYKYDAEGNLIEED